MASRSKDPWQNKTFLRFFLTQSKTFVDSKSSCGLFFWKLGKIAMCISGSFCGNPFLVADPEFPWRGR